MMIARTITIPCSWVKWYSSRARVMNFLLTLLTHKGQWLLLWKGVVKLQYIVFLKR